MIPPVATETSTTTNNASIPLIIPNPKSNYTYEHLLPVFEKSERYPSLKPFEHTDPGARAAALPESEQKVFLKSATRVRNLTPGIGTGVVGIGLASLDGPSRDRLALGVARRGVIAFRDQPKFLAQSAEQFREWEELLWKAPHSSHCCPASIPELHIVYRDANTVNRAHLSRISTTFWHSDVSYELQPPGLITFFLLPQPSSGGGDTLFVSQVLALKKPSPPFVDFLRTLKAVHSGMLHAQIAREGCRSGGGVVRRDPVGSGMSFTDSARSESNLKSILAIHPVARRHLVT